MSQRRAKVVTVTDADGLSGTIDTTSPTLNKRDRQALVRLDDGRQILVPVEELRPEDDGTFRVDFSFSELADGAAVAPRRRAPAGRRAEGGGGSGLGQDDETVVVPVVAEKLDVRKRVVEGGGVRITKTVREREEVVDEPLMREEVHVKRVPVGRVVDGPVPVRHVGNTMIVSLLEEVLVVEKRLMLKEELHISKDEVETHRPQRVVLRSEEATVQRVGDADEQEPEGAGGDDELTGRP